MKKIISLRGLIGRDVKPAAIEKQLQEAEGAPVEGHIASPGGLAYDSIEIFNLFRRYPGKVHMHVTSLAASGASYIALAGNDKPTVERNSTFFIHNAQGVGVGDQNVMKKMADILENLSNVFAREYARVSGKNLPAIKSMMDEETEMIGDDIVKNGFASQVLTDDYDEEEDEDAVALARLEIENCRKYVSAHHLSETEVNQLAALLDQSERSPAESHAGKIKLKEVESMTLKEFLDQNPAEKIKFEAGSQKYNEAMKAAKYLRPGGSYPDTIRALACDVIEGKKSLESLETTVGAYDAMMETQKSSAAMAESAAYGNVHGQQFFEGSVTGQVNNESDFMVELKRTKVLAGQEVK